MAKELRKRMAAQTDKLEVFNKEKKNNQAQMKNIITEMKNTLKSVSSRLNNTEEQISGLEDRVVEITKAEHRKEKNTSNPNSTIH